MVFGSGRSINNKELLFPTAGHTVEIFFLASGNNTSSNPFKWYFNLKETAASVNVRTDKTVLITEINGEILDDPITVTSNGFKDRVQPYSKMRYTQMKIMILTAATDLKVTGRV